MLKYLHHIQDYEKKSPLGTNGFINGDYQPGEHNKASPTEILDNVILNSVINYTGSLSL